MSSNVDKVLTNKCVSRNRQILSSAEESFSQKNVRQNEINYKSEPVLSSSPDVFLRCEKTFAQERGMVAEKNRKTTARNCECNTVDLGASVQKAVSSETVRDTSRTEKIASSSERSNVVLVASPCKNTLYGQIINKKVKANIIHEDEHVIAFFDPEPQAPIHFLVVPKKPIAMLENTTEEDESLLGKLLLTAARTAKKLECVGGYRVVINNGRNACQKVNYLHLHVFGGRQLGWPPC